MIIQDGSCQIYSMGVHGWSVSCRKEPKQRKVGNVRQFFNKRFQPLAEDHSYLRYTRIAQLASPMNIKADFNAYTSKYRTENHDEKAFVEFHNFRAIGYYKDILGLPGAVQPWIPDGMSDQMPEFFKNKTDWALWMVLADPDHPGQPLAGDVFERDWARRTTTPTGNPVKDLFHHIVKNHEGELRSMDQGKWVKMWGVPPDALLHPQFSMDHQQFRDVKGKLNKGKGKDKGKGKADKGQPLAASKGKGNVDQPLADLKVPGFENRILHIANEHEYWVWTGGLTSLPRLAHALGAQYSLHELYGFWCAMDIRVTHREHPWPNQIKSDAAMLRKKETGRFGHRA